MTPDETKASYRVALDEAGELITVRRYTGTGLNRPRFDWTLRARVTRYDPEELVGTIQQGDRRIIAMADDLTDVQFPLPFTSTDKIMLRGKELQVMSIDDSTRRVQGVLIAYEIQARG